MKNLRYIFFAVFFVFSCHTIPKDYKPINGELITKSLGMSCNELFNEITQKWAIYNDVTKEKGCYYYDRNLIAKILKNKKCFLGLKLNDVYGLLGEPSGVYDHNIFYLMSKKCKYEYDYINDKYYHLRFTVVDTIGDVDYYQIVTDY